MRKLVLVPLYFCLLATPAMAAEVGGLPGAGLPAWMHVVGIVSFWLATAAILLFSVYTEVLRGSDPGDFGNAPLTSTGAPDTSKKRFRRPYSLSQSQAAWWFWIVISSYVYLAWTTGDIGAGLNEQALTLLGIGAGTAVGAALIDQNRDTATPALTAFNATLASIRDPATPPADLPGLYAKLNAAGDELASENFLNDILTDADGISLHRFQSFAWTVVLGATFLVYVYLNRKVPDFNAYELGLLGISSGTYLGLKIPEKQA